MSEVARVRLGVTMQINVPVLTDGDEVSLVGRNISAIIVAPNRKQYMLDFTLDGEHMNKVKAVFEGMIHEVTGLHRIMIVENLGKESQTLFDMDAVNLVARSSMASALDSSLPMPVVQLSGGSLFVGGKGGEDGVGISSIQFVGHVTGGNKYKILLTSGAEYFFLANDGQDGQDGHTPYIQDKYWYINGESTGIKADYSDEEAARQSAYQAAEANRNGAYEDAENDRDEDFVASEAQRQQEFTQAEAARTTSVQAAQAAAEDAAESAQEAVQKFNAIKDAIDDLDPSQSTSDAIVAEAAARAAKDAELESTLGQLGPKIDQTKAELSERFKSSLPIEEWDAQKVWLLTDTSTAGKWYGGDSYGSVFVPVVAGQTYKLVAGSANMPFAFFATNEWSHNGVATYVVGGERTVVNAGLTNEGVVPNGALYMWIPLYSGSTSFAPAHLFLDDVDWTISIHEILSNIIHQLSAEDKNDTISLSVLPYYFVSSNGEYKKSSSNTVGCVRFDAKAGTKATITCNVTNTMAMVSKYKNGTYTVLKTTTGVTTFEYDITEDCVIVVSCYNSTPTIIISHKSWVSIAQDNPRKIVVDTNGSGEFTKVADAVEYANTLNGEANIYILEGIYNIYTELGGDTWRQSITHDDGERQGIHLADGVNMFGVGHVELHLELPDDVTTYVQSQCPSTINMSSGSNRLENLQFYAKNCRYACHDESNGGNYNLKRFVKNCYFEHKGNQSGLWTSMTAMGGGASGGSSYDWINCQFVTNGFFQAFSYHTNNNQRPSHFNIDGCVGLCKSYTGTQTIRSFCAQYYGTNHVGKTVFNFKNCTGNGEVIKRAQTDSSEDHIDVYVNGYNQITL